MKRILSIVFAIAAASMLAACGGGSSSSSAAADNSASNMASNTAADNGGAMGGNGAQTPNIDCGAVKPVWVNLNTKKYHEPGDQYYGNTKHGEFMCPAQARKAGYVPAGGGSMESSKHHKN